ncbi:hypothetical protein G7084_00435 [Weissella coleopterorum]|uniref:Uncharacterized protein n=1 Tax=Weissella coleopterorum TaxID=2714949 RepID=A0A6G8AY89_9LACO|nr:hypothetical protein [Weissella coleopterorum]QIL49925.1 hypothetical protein G7084_00435 [Weissella coleopterorum]
MKNGLKILLAINVILLLGIILNFNSINQNKLEASKLQRHNVSKTINNSNETVENSSVKESSETVDVAKSRVNETMGIILNSDPRNFSNSLKSKVSRSLINQLKTDMTPTVVTGKAQTQKVVSIGVKDDLAGLKGDPFVFLIIAKNDLQSNAYQVTYEDNQITEFNRATLKGTYNEIN